MTRTNESRLGLLCVMLGVALALCCVDAAGAAVPEASDDPAGKLVLVRDGRSVAPIVIYQDAPLLTRQIADELAVYIEKVTGARPQVIEGRPDPLPAHAIWVGYQPVLDGLFPKVDFDFKHPEEILIAANADHLVIAGRDVWDPDHPVGKDRRGDPLPGVQHEYGTINAVYTFLRDGLRVRWLWPGELGEDIIAQKTVAFAPFQHRHHPVFQMREGILRFSAHSYGGGPYSRSADWTRVQRMQLDSLEGNIGGHALSDWWERFHETNPEYFAMQPDGTRSLVTKDYHAKICHSNPAVWRQWVEDTAANIEDNPAWSLFDASPNDGGYSGHCICDDCRAWDHPDGKKMWLRWGGMGREYVALTDRHITFANKVGRMLAERFPERNDMVGMMAYGAVRPPPVEAVPADNVIIINVGNFFWGLDATDKDGTRRADWFAEWGASGAKQIWRPNTGTPAGWTSGLPDIPIERIVEAMRFVADHGAVGIFIDSVWEIWGTQGPLYYAMAHVAWDPQVDLDAVMDDYYQRGFGPAAAELKAYWTMLEEARNRKVDEYPGETNGYAEVYDEAFFRKAYGLLDTAAQKAGDSGKYAERIDFVRAGLDHTRIFTEIRNLGAKMLLADGKDEAVNDVLRAKWDEMKRNCEENPTALNWMVFRGGRRQTRVGLFHPDWLDKARSSHVAAWKEVARKAAGQSAKPRATVDLETAADAGWDLVFHDAFDRDTLGDAWQNVAGKWRVEDGALHGSGTLLSTALFPEGDAVGFQRMEFEAIAPADASRVSDLSSLLHAKPVEDPANGWTSGYFFQFGGVWNRKNRIARLGETLVADADPKSRIVPGKTHRIVVENNQGQLTLFVDGESVVTVKDDNVLVGEDAGRVGFYFYTPFKVDNVKVYVKRLAGGLDRDASEVQ